MDVDGSLDRSFEEHRAHLRAVGYRMLGSFSETDDALQEAWLRASRADTTGVENIGGWLTTVMARVCLNVLRRRRRRPEDPLDVHVPDVVVERDDGSGAASAAHRLGRPRPARGARHAGARRAAGLRAPRHVRRAVRGHRPHRRAHPDRHPPTGQPGTAARAGEHATRPTPTSAASASWSTPSSPRRATATSTRSLAVLDPDVVLRADTGAPTGLVRGAVAVARQALLFSRLARFRRPAIVNGAHRCRHGARGAGRRRSWRSRSPAVASSRSTSSPTRCGSPRSTSPTSPDDRPRGGDRAQGGLERPATTLTCCAGLAQLAEHLTCNRGSSATHSETTHHLR